MTTPENSTTEIVSQHPFSETLQLVTQAIEHAGLTIFARIDHAENARGVGLAMPAATVLIYGNAKGGTPVMLAAPGTALDLPLRVLVRETPSGAVVAYHPMAPVLQQAGLPDDMVHRLDPAQRILGEAVTR